jgi:Fic family protein
MAPHAPEDLLRRARRQFLEIPGLKLTFVQARRLWGLDRQTSEAILTRLAEDRFLAPTPEGTFRLGNPTER